MFCIFCTEFLDLKFFSVKQRTKSRIVYNTIVACVAQEINRSNGRVSATQMCVAGFDTQGLPNFLGESNG